MHIAIAHVRRTNDTTEAALIAAYERFERDFVIPTDGVSGWVLANDGDGNYAEVCFFDDEAALGAVMQAAQTNEAAAAFFSMLDSDQPPQPYAVVRRYEA